MIRLTLPLPPTSNQTWRAVGGRIILSKVAREYAELVDREALAQLRGLKLESGDPLRLTIAMFVKHGRDIDSGKFLQDCVARCLGFDDRIIVELHVTKATDRANPRAEVRLEVAGQRP